MRGRRPLRRLLRRGGGDRPAVPPPGRSERPGVTIDFETIEKDGTFTLRERDSMAQRRIDEAELFALLEKEVY